MSDILPFSTEERYAAARQRALDSRSRKARVLQASGYGPYAQLGGAMAKEEAQAADDARQEVQRAFSEKLQAEQLGRETARDKATEAYRTGELAHRSRQDRINEQHYRDEAARYERDYALKLKMYGLDEAAQSAPPQKTVGGTDILPGLHPKAPPSRLKEVDDSRSNIAQLQDLWKGLEEHPGTYGGAVNRTLNMAQAPFARVPGVGPMLESVTSNLTLDPKERETRHLAANIVDQVIKTMSGAQVSLQEELRKSYLPKPYDSMAQIREKVRALLIRNLNNYHSFGGLGQMEVPEHTNDEALVNQWKTAAPQAPAQLPPVFLQRPQ